MFFFFLHASDHTSSSSIFNFQFSITPPLLLLQFSITQTLDQIFSSSIYPQIPILSNRSIFQKPKPKSINSITPSGFARWWWRRRASMTSTPTTSFDDDADDEQLRWWRWRRRRSDDGDKDVKMTRRRWRRWRRRRRRSSLIFCNFFLFSFLDLVLVFEMKMTMTCMCM